MTAKKQAPPKKQEPKPERRVETAADRRNYLRKQAGWPVKDR